MTDGAGMIEFAFARALCSIQNYIGQLRYLRATGETGRVTWRARVDPREFNDAHLFKSRIVETKS